MEDRPNQETIMAIELMELEEAQRQTASWLYWIAGLTVAGALLRYYGFLSSNFSMLIAMRYLDGTTMLVASIVSAAVLILVGKCAVKQQEWAFIVAMIAIALDGLLGAMYAHWISVAVHGYVLMGMYNSWRASQKIKELMWTSQQK
jgi:hypothetical protein